MIDRIAIATVLLPFALMATARPHRGVHIPSTATHSLARSLATCLATNAPHDSLVVVALTDAGARLIVLGATSGEVLHAFSLGPVRHAQSPDASGGDYPDGSLALDERTCEVIAAAVDSSTGVTHVSALSLRDWQLRPVATIADTSGFPWVDIGPSSGKLYLMGRKGIRVTVLDRASGAIVAIAHESRPGFAERFVFRARVAPDERRVYVSYHGGLDWIDLATGKLCPDPVISHYPAYTIVWGCRDDVHGDFNFFRNDIVAASGDSRLLIYDSTVTLRRQVSFGDGYPLGHFMWPGVDTRRGIVYGTVYCAGGKGILEVSVVQEFAGARSLASSACGQRLTPTTDGHFLIGIDSQFETVQVIDLKVGEVTHVFERAQTGGHPLDVLGVAVEHR